MKKLIVFFFIFSLFFISCSNGSKSKEDVDLFHTDIISITNQDNSENQFDGEQISYDDNLKQDDDTSVTETENNIVVEENQEVDLTVEQEDDSFQDENSVDETDEDVVTPQDECGGCSGHGKCMVWENNIKVCACDLGFTSTTGLDCVPTSSICKGGTINYDIDGDGKNETSMTPSAQECEMFEKINYLRAVTDDKEHNKDECRTPLGYSLLWSAHGRNHSKKMFEKHDLFHEDFPNGQNVAYGCGVDCELNMYMNGDKEPPCPQLSHHCNIMRCWGSGFVGIGYWDPETGTFNTQNFY